MYFAQRRCLIEVVDVSRFGAFEDASVYPLISTFSSLPLDMSTPVIAKLPAGDGKAFDSIAHQREFIDALPNHNWGVLLSRGARIVQSVQSVSIPLGQVLEICASTTAAEADSFSPLIFEEQDVPVERKWKVVNTGLIDPFIVLWGTQPIRHSKKTFQRPWLADNENILPRRRADQYSSPKLIFAKLALRIEAFFDEKGEYAALNSNFAFAEGKEGYFYLGLLNSSFCCWLYRQLFGALSMGGDYMQFQAPQLKAMPIVQYDKDDPAHGHLASLALKVLLEPGRVKDPTRD